MTFFASLLRFRFLLFIVGVFVCVGFASAASAATISGEGRLAVAQACTTKDEKGADVSGYCLESCNATTQKSYGACAGVPGLCCVNVVSPSQAATSTDAAKGYFNTFGYNPPLGNATIPQLIVRFILQVLPLIGSLFFLMFLWGGFQWFTAGGDEGKVKNARSTLVNAVIGIAIIMFAYSIVSYLISVFAAGLRSA